jgi:hypothetical protein
MNGASAYPQQQYAGPVPNTSFHVADAAPLQLNPSVSQVVFSEYVEQRMPRIVS